MLQLAWGYFAKAVHEILFYFNLVLAHLNSDPLLIVIFDHIIYVV